MTGAGRRLAIVVLGATFVAGAAAPGRAQNSAASLAEAQRRFGEGRYAEVVAITGSLTGDARLGRADRAEAFRLQGLSQFFLQQPDAAEASLYQFLRLDPEAHFDPALVPPDAVSFLENVRARHEGELRALKPRPKRKRNRWLNLIPPAGQFQNEQPFKGWTIGVSEVVLLATNISTYAILANECGADRTCSLKRSTADHLRLANLVSGALFIGVYVVGVLDGFHVHQCLDQLEQPPPIGIVPQDGGASMILTLGF